MDLNTVLTSTVIASLVSYSIAGFVNTLKNERNISTKYITNERKLWRDKIRIKAREAVEAYNINNDLKLEILYIEFQLLLNPFDENDVSILDTLWEMKKVVVQFNSYKIKYKLENLPIVLSEKVSLLLKHDWERAKKEAKPFYFRLKKTDRKKHSNYEKKRRN